MTESLSSNTTFSHYRIVSKIGAGGMGEVWLAEDTRLKRKIALKLLPAELTFDAARVRRFEQEAQAASALNHPNIITVYDIGESDAGRFIVMELVAGRTLRAVIAEDNSLETFLPLGIQMAKALSAAHAAGITHRDIKPENIMVRDDGYVKVLDFGLARLLPHNASDSETATLPETTRPGTLLGTVAYMSPEQASGQSVSHPSDIFALGIVLYELATRRHPFKAKTQVGYLHAITSQAPAPLTTLRPEIPAALNTLIVRMLDKDARLRPTASEIAQQLQELERRGYGESGRHSESESAISTRNGPQSTIRHTVGREGERHELRAAFGAAEAGRGSLLCVTGEPGIGKTTLVEDFLSELAAEGRGTIARGRCSERLAGTEAYLPLLEALESLLRQSTASDRESDSLATLCSGRLVYPLYRTASDRESDSLATLMRQLAPTWYTQVVPLSGESEESARLLAEVKAASQERMKRELANFLQSVAQSRPLVIFFEDLHWADVSTIDLLSFLAGKFDVLKALIVVTYRPSDMLLVKHPFLQIKPDLQARGVCRELMLEFLTAAEITEYLALEFPQHGFPAEFPRLIHAKTEGSPLFMADVVRYLRDRGVIRGTDFNLAQTQAPQTEVCPAWTLAQALPDIERELPESVRGMIERKIAQLEPDDRKLLTAASVQGYEFDSAVAAQVLKLEADEIEERLETLERVFAFVKLTSEAEFPNHTLTLKYRFVHVLYQNALYASLRMTRRVALSREVAEALEGFYSQQRASVASDLAALWEAAREYARAAEYFRLAAGQASQVWAVQEAAALARRGLRMIEMLPESRRRHEQELSLRIALGNALIAIQGPGAPEVEQTYSRAHKLSQELEDAEHLLPVLWGMATVYHARARYRKALEYGEELLRLAERLQRPTVVVAQGNVGCSLFYLGELEQARDYLQQSASLYTPAQHRPLTWLYGHEPGMIAEFYLGLTLWLLGQPDQAVEHSRESVRLGREVSHAQSLAFALVGVASTYQCCGDSQRVDELAREGAALAAEQGLPHWFGQATAERGWVRVVRGEVAEGMVEMRRGIDAFQFTGAEIHLTYHLGLVAEAYGKAAQPSEGLAVLAQAQALVEKNEERFWEAELYRLKGELLRGVGAAASEVEACFHQALEIARRRQAKSLELRTVMSLARLWKEQGKRAEARQMLTGVYGWFSEGFDTADLKEAKALLVEL